MPEQEKGSSKSADGPKKGERVLACPHRLSPCHWIRLDPPDTFTNGQTGDRFESRWVALCGRCHRRPDSAVAKARRDFVLDEDQQVTRPS